MRPVQLPGESLSQYAIRLAYEYGHFWSPENPEGHNVKQEDLKLLKVSDPVVMQALRGLSMMDQARYAEQTLKAHMRLPHFDGEFGPAMAEFVQLGRCPVPDHAPPPGVDFAFDDPYVQKVVERMQLNALEAVGGGNWPRCHNVGDFHCSIMEINPAGMNPRVVPLQKRILANMQNMYAGIGLLWLFVDQNGNDLLTGKPVNGRPNTRMTFVQNSSGWIGLAIVGQNERCDSEIWLKILATYLGGSTDDDIVNQQSTLWGHEAGHNSGLPHTNGGIMNPSIVNRLPVGIWPANDPSTSRLVGLYGGVRVPIPGGGIITPPDQPIKTTQEWLEFLDNELRMQKAAVKWMAGELGKLQGR